jgi:hypothetical protein
MFTGLCCEVNAEMSARFLCCFHIVIEMTFAFAKDMNMLF